MPDDLNNKMDEMLRNYAQQRRNVPDPQMHPATRKVLQGEVARLYKKEEKKAGFLAKMGRFWPQYAIGLAAVVVLLGVILPGQLGSKSKPKANKPTVVQTTSESDKERSEGIAPPGQAPAELYFKKENEVAQEPQITQLKDQVADTKLKEVERVDVPTPAAPPSVGRERQLAETSEKSPAKKTESADRGEAGVALNAPVPANRGVSIVTKNGEQLSRRYAPALDAAAAAQNESSVDKLTKQSKESLALVPAESRSISLSTMKRVSELTNLGNALRSKFVQINTNPVVAVAAGAAPNGTASPILASFQLEQLGEKLRFVDRDGSVYDGQVLTNVPAAEEAKTVVAQSAVQLRVPQQQQSVTTLGAASQPQSQSLFLENAVVNNFRAAGMNRTLGKDVVISGLLYERTNQSAAEKSAYQNQQNVVAGNRVQAYGQGQLNQQQLNQVSQANRAIVGTAVVGSTNEVPIQAISNE
jgi:hypothetical protein